MIFTSEDGRTTRFWLADPGKPSVRRLLLAVEHQQGWAGVAAVSPNGRLVAYTLLAPADRDPDHAAQLLLLDLQAKQSRPLVLQVDLRSTLIWSPDSSSISFQRFEGERQQLWSEPAAGGTPTLTASSATGERLVPVGYQTAAGGLLAAHYGSAGVDLVRLRADNAPEPVQHLSDGTARNFSLSATGDRLAFLATGPSPTEQVSHAYVADLRAATVHQLPADWGEMVGVVWQANGVLDAGSSGPEAAIRAESGERIPVPGGQGFWQPLQWSPSGRYLAVRGFSGQSADQPGTAREALLTQRGKILAITESQPVRFVGWSAGGH